MTLSEAQLRAIYDQHYVEIYDPHAVDRIGRLLPYFELSRGQTVADFGCGNGVLSQLIASRVGRYVGVDFSEAFIREAERGCAAAKRQIASFYCAAIA